MGCYTDQGFVERLKVSICQAMILLTWATILKILRWPRLQAGILGKDLVCGWVCDLAKKSG